MDQFLTEYWPFTVAMVTAFSAVAKVVIGKFPSTKPYLYWLTPLASALGVVGRGIKSKVKPGSKR